MMEVYINFFEKFTAKIDNQIIDLENVLGKQLSGLFALLIINHGKVVSKEQFINALWKDSDNPANALKYAIHRLRNSLQQISFFKDIEVIETVKSGYQINNNIKIKIDYEIFIEACKKAHSTNDIEDLKHAISLYTGDYLMGWESDTVYLERAHYKIAMIEIVELLCKRYIELNLYEECLKICLFGLSYDDLNEELIYGYIKSLIETKQYNEALNYYSLISNRMNQDLGIGLQEKTSSLLNMMGTSQSSTVSLDINEFSQALYDSNSDLKGPMYCDYTVFKSISEYEIRTSIRNNKMKYILFIHFVEGKTDVDALVNVVSQTLRIDDVYTKVSNSQIAILCSLHQNSDAYIVGERIISKYYNKVDKDARLMYSVKLITDESVMNKRGRGSLFVV